MLHNIKHNQNPVGYQQLILIMKSKVKKKMIYVLITNYDKENDIWTITH